MAKVKMTTHEKFDITIKAGLLGAVSVVSLYYAVALFGAIFGG